MLFNRKETVYLYSLAQIFRTTKCMSSSTKTYSPDPHISFLCLFYGKQNGREEEKGNEPFCRHSVT